MKNIKLLIEYDGKNYHGWQRQKNQITIQEKIEEAIYKVTGEEIDLLGSSRTDSGVHAKGFVANFHTNSSIPPEKFREAINSKLPGDIVILNSEEVNKDFHARYSSKGKTYCYTLLNRDVPSALNRHYVHHIKVKLDINKMKEACKYFIGKHDFTAFKTNGSSVKTSIRTITDLHIEIIDDYIKIYITADGFLYNMVRIIVGTLINVGTNKIEPKEIENIINAKDRQKAGKCVSAEGLSLEKVFY
ncbi:tRNA pseudouridine(38-40) synthase TruA [Clostridium fallax]|uniref:tRNA pseudouridine synthase A n=1 Tax=Clostridium fallax TaxID=1533 RepID=A0A1M4TS70_9CLOT|nr:tRNA pseudouridine(38-40) synthase TruA [Clostridium fallax]SHE47256.1 tRNA pseudouridine38-40 synthase [Clostridium fallax]SQB22424.1 tRNA pseudouridine synthase A [Clostridium fallax]